MNLMLNGIEAMKETGGVLTVKTGPGEGDQVLDLSQRHRSKDCRPGKRETRSPMPSPRRNLR